MKTRQLFLCFVILITKNAKALEEHKKNDEKPQDSFLSCIREICGVEEKLDTDVELSNKFSLEDLPADLQFKISKMYDQLALASINVIATNDIKAFRKILKDNKIPEKTGLEIQERLLTILNLMDFVKWEQKPNESETTKIDETIKGLPDGFSLNEKKQIIEVMNELNSAGVELELSKIYNYPLTLYLKMNFPNTEESAAFKAIAEEHTKDTEELASYFPEPIKSHFLPSKKNADLYLKGTVLSESEMIEIVARSIIHQWLLKILNEKEKFPKFYSWSGLKLNKLKEVFPIEKTLDDMENFYTTFSLENETYKAKKAAHLNAFASRYLIAAKLNKTELKKEVDDLINQMQGFLKGKLSQKTMGQINLKNQKLQFPDSKSSILSSLEDSIKESTKTIKEKKEFYKMPEDLKNKVSTLFASRNLINWDEQIALSDLDDAFDFLDRPLANDISLNVDQGFINISPYSAYATEYKAGIVLHELGHGFRYALTQATMSKHSAGVFFKSRACLSKRHTDKQVRSFAYKIEDDHSKVSDEYEINNSHTEEDWADMISGLSLKNSDKNFTCSFIDQIENKYQIPSLLDDEAEDTHSTSLFRLLHVEAAHKGKLPDSCNTAIKDSGINIDFTPCL